MELSSDLLYKNISKLNSYKRTGGINVRTDYFAFLTMCVYPKVLGIKNIFMLISEREWVDFKKIVFPKVPKDICLEKVLLTLMY